MRTPLPQVDRAAICRRYNSYLRIDSKLRISPRAQYKRPDSPAKAFIRAVSTYRTRAVSTYRTRAGSTHRTHEVICRRETMQDV